MKLKPAPDNVPARVFLCVGTRAHRERQGRLESIAETDVSVTERVIGDKEMPGVCSSPDNESEPALSGKKRVRLILVR